MSSINQGNPLIDRERIRGASRMIAEGRDAASVTAEEIAQVAADVEVFRRAHKIARSALARTVGYSESVLSEFLAGKYKGNNGQVAIDLENWLRAEEEKQSRPEVTQFVMTNVALEIKATAMYCLDERTIGLVYGPDTSGMGKTTALQAIHQLLGPRQSALVTIDKVDANPTGVLKKLCMGLHIDDKGSNKARFDRVSHKIKGRKFIFLIDQIHNLRWSKDHKPFYILCDLFDATGTSQLWTGTADLVGYLKKQETKAFDESLAQIRRRIFPCVDLVETLSSPTYGGNGGPMCVSIEQVREIFAKNKLKLTPAAQRFICQLCNQPDSGSVGLAVQLVKFATMRAELMNRRSIDMDLIEDALNRGLTHDRAQLLITDLKAVESPMYKVG